MSVAISNGLECRKFPSPIARLKRPSQMCVANCNDLEDCCKCVLLIATIQKVMVKSVANGDD